jgi:hypothetical protein
MAVHPFARALIVLVCPMIAAACDGGAHSLDVRDSGGPSKPRTKPSRMHAALDAATPDGGRADAASLPPPGDGEPGHVIAEPEDEASYVFDPDEVRTYNIVIEPDQLAMLDADPSAETYVDAKLEVDGETFGPLGVRYKGSVGAFYTPCTSNTLPGEPPTPKVGKCSIKIDFDRDDSKLRFHGLKKLNLHSMGRDMSLMRERLGYALFREFGVAAPRAMHARVLINGELEGLFVAVEQLDGRFTHSRFSDGGDGNLYKEVWPTSESADDYRNALETNEGSATPVDKMIAFKHAIDHGADAAFAWLDPRYAFNYIAADRVIINDDGAFHWYCTYNHNYLWYEAEHADRVWLIPWDLDGAFEGGSERVHIITPWNAPAQCTCGIIDFQLPSICDPLTSYWAARDGDYQRAVDAFVAGPFSADRVDAKLRRWTAQIDAAVQEASGLKGAPTYGQWQDAFATLQQVIHTSREHRGYPYDLIGSGEDDAGAP